MCSQVVGTKDSKFHFAFGFCGPLAHIFKAAHVRHLKNVSSTWFFYVFILTKGYAHWRRGRRHHFVKVFISTSIVACELQYNSPMQYVEAQGWTFSNKCKLHYQQIQENIFWNSTSASAKLHVGFKGMVNRLYNMIEKDSLRDLFTGKPAINFLDKDSFVQKLHLHAQEFQMAVIIVKEFFINTSSITMAMSSIGWKKCSNPA